MANEQLFKDRWLDDFHGSSEFQNAQRRDAIAKFQREAQARQAMQTALRGGNARKAAGVQQNLQDENTQEGIGASGEVGAENAFQNQRANDYITQAESRGRAQAATLRQQPLSGVTQTGNYLFGLQNPDFSTYTPNADTSRLHYGDGLRQNAGNVPRGTVPPVASGAPATPPIDYTQRQLALNAQNLARSTQRHEDHFISSLPPDLKSIYPSFQSKLSPQEAKDFLNESPELRYGKLRAFQPRSATPTPLGADRLTMGNQTYTATSGGPKPIGSVGSSDLTFSTPEMPTVKPVGNSRPEASLPVSEWWNQVDKPATGF